MKSEIQSRLAMNLKRLRKAKKLTQFELAEKANISEAMVKSIELSLAWPSDKTLTQLSEALGIDVFNFFIPIDDDIFLKTTIFPELKEAIRNTYNTYVKKIFSDLELEKEEFN